ncbi:EpsG family protein [Rossellomorea aquimaris]|uniref:EpsG family protein n=1 Tax=Rossellomorea aquimaris TaxID=189382 RepID=UPI0007D082EB|nr:EpsG family protein [Rossellomorea aquimaris]
MFIYMTLLSYWAITAIAFNANSRIRLRYNSKLYVLIAGISLFVVMALRDVSVGTDILGYLNEYENGKYYLNNLIRDSELGYSYFNYALGQLGLNFQAYLAIIAAIFVITMSLLYYLYSKNILLSFYLHVTIGIFAMSMSGLRQTIAISLTILAFIYLIKNKKILFFIFVGIAYFFHNSAIVFLLVFFLRKIRINKKTGFIIYGLSCVAFIGRGLFGSLVQQLTPEKYIRYLDNTAYVNPLLIVVVMALPLACLFFWPKSSNEHNEDYIRVMSISFVLSCINFVVFFLAMEIPLFERISLYFMIYITLLIPNVIQGIKSKNIRVIAMMACIIFPLIQFIISTPGGSMGIDNYKFFWE